MNSLVVVVIGALVLLLVILALSAIRVVQQYERGVIFVLGRLTGRRVRVSSWCRPSSHA